MDPHSEDVPIQEADSVGKHEHQKSVLDRLARIEGQVRAVRRMVEEETPCPEVLVKIAAIRSALNGVGRVILEDQLKCCMLEAAENGNFDEAFKDLQNSLRRLIE